MELSMKSDAYVLMSPDKGAHGAYFIGPNEIRFIGANAATGFFGPENMVSVGKAIRQALLDKGMALPAFAVVVAPNEDVAPSEIDYSKPQPAPRRKPGRPRLADRVPPPAPTVSE